MHDLVSGILVISGLFITGALIATLYFESGRK